MEQLGINSVAEELVDESKKTLEDFLEDWEKEEISSPTVQEIQDAAKKLKGHVITIMVEKEKESKILPDMEFNITSLKNFNFTSSSYFTRQVLNDLDDLQAKMNSFLGQSIKMAIVYRDPEENGAVHVYMEKEESLFNAGGKLKNSLKVIKDITTEITPNPGKESDYKNLEKTYSEVIRRADISAKYTKGRPLYILYLENEKDWMRVKVNNYGVLSEIFSYFFFEQIYDFTIDSSMNSAVKKFITLDGLTNNQKPDSQSGILSEDISLGGGRYIGIKSLNASKFQIKILLTYLDKIINATDMKKVLEDMAENFKNMAHDNLMTAPSDIAEDINKTLMESIKNEINVEINI